MLKRYRSEYIGKNAQFILIDPQGTVLESDQAIIPIEKGQAISELHPFFETLGPIDEIPEEGLSFYCVHLSYNDNDLTTDIKMFPKKEGALLIIENLTEHYRAYQAMAQSRNESIINEELVALKNLELEERERFKNTFIQNFSHELRNPLTGIISITNIIGKTSLTGEQRTMIDFLKETNAHLRLMLEDTLSLSMIASGRLKMSNKEFSLLQLLDLIDFTYGAKAKQKGLEFSRTCDSKLPEFVSGDRLRLFQILTNLLDNAIKYTDSGSVSLVVNRNQKRANRVSLRFEVSDTGEGIPEPHLSTIFESFIQLDPSKKDHGSGLGLAIVKGLLAQMGSHIKVESVLGKGSTFYFDVVLNVPLHPLAETIPKGGKKFLGKGKGPNKDGKYTILMVEDDERIQTVLFKTLADTNLFYIDLINDGAMVMEQLVHKPYDLILMDINLPNVTGDQITRLIREFPFKNIKNIPIVGLTANAFQEDMKAYMDFGMNAVLSKPFEEELLLQTIFKALK